MNIAVFSAKNYDKHYLAQANLDQEHQLEFFEARLNPATTPLTAGFDAVCVFVNDVLNSECLHKLKQQGVKLIALRCSGFNNVDLEAAKESGITVVRVPAYSPHAVAEHTAAMLLTVCRKIHRSYSRVRNGNFSLDGLMGFELHNKTIGIIGTGKIGACFAQIMVGFGSKVLAFDLHQNQDLADKGVEYLPIDDIFTRADIISLHCPLTPKTHHLINDNTLATMKDGVVILNTSRGALIDTSAVIAGLKSGHITGLALDVYEEEEDLFFEDLSTQVIQDDVFARLLTFPNVVITGHQAFFTDEALTTIADITIGNIREFETTGTSANAISTK
jgi:D-lactate dehydrogenase